MTIVLNLSAQTIEINTVTEEGHHIIASSYVYSGFPGIFVSLAAAKTDINGNDTILYQLQIRYGNPNRTSIDKGKRLLLKLSDSTVVTLKNESAIDLLDNKREVTTTYSVYFVFPKYELSHQELQKLMDLEVCKIRLEHNTDVYTVAEDKKEYKNKVKKSFHKNEFSTILRSAYAQIQDALFEKKDIYSDF